MNALQPDSAYGAVECVGVAEPGTSPRTERSSGSWRRLACVVGVTTAAVVGAVALSATHDTGVSSQSYSGLVQQASMSTRTKRQLDLNRIDLPDGFDDLLDGAPQTQSDNLPQHQSSQENQQTAQSQQQQHSTSSTEHVESVHSKNSAHEQAMEQQHEFKEREEQAKWQAPQTSSTRELEHPHIIKVLIDDMGHNDMGYNNNNGDVWTPTMDALAGEGIILHRYYTQFTCTPSRAAFLTGKLPIHVGLQHGQIFYNQPWGLPLDHSTMPQFLDQLGYASHIVGKWHLGHYNEASLPTARGFDSFFGMLDGAQFYSTHVDAMRCNLPGQLLYNGNEDYTSAFKDITSKGCYFDFFTDNHTEPGYFGQYNTFLFRDRAVEKLREHAATSQATPLFLYLAFNAVHSPVSSPHSTFDKYPELKTIQFDERKRFSAALRLVDDAVAEVVSTLQQTGMYENSLILVSSDNGANPENGGSNSPLRGSKGYLFEGGVRCPAFIHGPNVIPAQKKGSVYYGMFHISDWLPTLVEGVLGKPELLAGHEIDGLNLWPSLAGNEEPKRNEMLLNIDYLDGSLAYGSQPLGYDTAALVHGPWKLVVNSGELDWYDVPEDKDGVISLWSSDKVVSPHTYLFNLLDDPEEHTNVADTYPHIVDKLLMRIADYRASMVTCEWRGDDDLSLGAIRADGFIGPWFKGDEQPPKSGNCVSGFDIEHAQAKWIKGH